MAQEQARRKTALLACYFLISLVIIVLLVTLLVYICVSGVIFSALGATGDQAVLTFFQWLGQPIGLGVVGCTLVSILLVTLVRTIQLKSGGSVIAQWAGGRLLAAQEAQSAEEKRLVNLVDEMSIASGMPVPSLYLLDREQGINAFVAGFEPTETVLVITKGALDQLTRDELQGVIGHEFSHILNGDMRLNMRLTAFLAGIQSLGQLGKFLLHPPSGRSKSKNSGVLIIFGVGLISIGFVGVLCGRIIKGAISRQREFLADASSVQFTRNPQGIAGALYQIERNMNGSILSSAHSEDISHFCFGEAVSFFRKQLFSTHPPLEDRIKAVFPGFYQSIRNKPQIKASSVVPTLDDIEYSSFSARTTSTSIPFAAHAAPAEVLKKSVGRVSGQHLNYAKHFLASLPELLQLNRHLPAYSQAVIYYLLLKEEKLKEDKQPLEEINRHILQSEGETFLTVFHSITQVLEVMHEEMRFPLLQLALSDLRSLDQVSKEAFFKKVGILIDKLLIDEIVSNQSRQRSLFEGLIFLILKKELMPTFKRRRCFNTFKPVLPDIHYILMIILQVGGYTNELLSCTHNQFFKSFGTLSQPKNMQEVKLSVHTLQIGMLRLQNLTPMLKQPIIEVCIDAIKHDQLVTVDEADLVRLFAWLLDCPIPPIVIES